MKISLKLALGILGSVIGWRILAGMVTLGWGPTPAVALSLVQPVAISIGISNGISNGIFNTHRAHVGMPLNFSASVSRGGLDTVDVYMGAITPDKRIFSWVPDTGGFRLTEGLAPIAQGVTALYFSTSALLRQDAHYTFSGEEVTGMYLVFTLVATPGADPSDADGWQAVNMVPLIFQP